MVADYTHLFLFLENPLNSREGEGERNRERGEINIQEQRESENV